MFRPGRRPPGTSPCRRPTGQKDPRPPDAVAKGVVVFEELVAGGKTILMVTHDDDLAHRVTRTVTIADGAIVGDERTTPAWQQNGVAAAAVHSNGKVETPLIPVPNLSVPNPEVLYA